MINTIDMDHSTGEGNTKENVTNTESFNPASKGLKMGIQNSDLSAVDIRNHVEQLLKDLNETQHTEILEKLLAQFEPLDFLALAYPEVTELKEELETLPADGPHAREIRKRLDNLKIKSKHYQIISIENALKIAERNRWGLGKNHDFIYLFNGKFWNEVNSESFQKFLGEAAERMGVPMFSARHYQFREQLFKQFLATAYLPVPVRSQETVLINLLNGTFEITTKGTRLRQFDWEDFITYQLPFEYDNNAAAPLFKRYLDRVLPDIDSQSLLAEYLGYIFIKNGSSVLKEEKALVLYGSGANGKSVLFEIVNALLGTENLSSFSLSSLTNDNGYFRAKLANKLVNYASEINGNLEASIFKALVSGEPVEARLPYGQPFMLRQYAKLIFNCNELPKDVEHTNAYFRRFLIIPFEVTIPEHEQDKQLHRKIIDRELPGIFNWVLAGLTRLLEQKRFSDCEAAKKALEQYKLESNSIQLYLDERGYQRSHDHYMLIKELYSEYKAYCIDDGMKPFNKRNFIRQLQRMGFIITRGSGGNMIVYIHV